MVLKRKNDGSAENDTKAKEKAKLIEHLVNKTLDINPSLASDENKRDILKTLSGEKKKDHIKSAVQSPQSTQKEERERKKSTITFFFEQKEKEYELANASILARLDAIKEEQQRLKQNATEQLKNFLCMLEGGANSVEAREVMREFRSFLERIEANESSFNKK